MRRRADDGAKVRREGEERPGYGLRGAIAGEETIAAYLAGRHEGLAQQRQHHVTAVENKRARAVKRFKEGYALRHSEAAEDGKGRRAGERRPSAPRAHGARDRHGNSRSIFARPYSLRTANSAERTLTAVMAVSHPGL